jgi:DNA-binding response OmpR family regulator
MAEASRERILIVEDEAPLASGLADLLAGEGYAAGRHWSCTGGRNPAWCCWTS